ncbi:hypothetical protein FRC06_009172, partial [Ceratobasidium sp. 370]
MATMEALRHEQRGYSFTRHNLGLRPVWPYWANLPYATGHTSFVPDLLHQMHQGMFKDHMLIWWMHILGTRTIDERLMGMLCFPGIRHFTKGISSFINSGWMGTELKAVAKVFLPLVAGSRPPEAVGAARCLMDFMYRANLPQIDDDDLEKLEEDLEEFHALKEIFVSEGALTTVLGWDSIPKLHMLSHYVFLIREFGTTDGYNTELPEQLHIDYVKIPYHASSKVKPTQQMITLLQRSEAWALQRRRLEEAGLVAKRCHLRPSEEEFEGGETNSQESESAENPEDDDEGQEEAGDVDDDGEEQTQLPTKHKQCHDQPEHHPAPTIYHAEPTKLSILGQDIALRHEAPNFINTVKCYISRLPSGETHAWLLSEDSRFGVWTRVYLLHDPLPFAPLAGNKIDSVHASRAQARQGLTRHWPREFDMVMLEVDPLAQGGR